MRTPDLARPGRALHANGAEIFPIFPIFLLHVHFCSQKQPGNAGSSRGLRATEAMGGKRRVEKPRAA